MPTRRERAWAAAATVCDPEIPVLTIADLGVLRETREAGDIMEVVITPTYSGCPAMNMIALDIATALDIAGVGPSRVVTVLAPALDHGLDDRGRAPQADCLRHRSPGRRRRRGGGPARIVRRRQRRLPALRLAADQPDRRVRLNQLQGAVALRRLPRAVRLFQVPLSP